MDSLSLAHARWKCQYHIVFIPKYRRKVLYGKLRLDIKEVIQKLCSYKNIEIVSGAVCIDHVHLCVSIPPKIAVSKFVGYTICIQICLVGGIKLFGHVDTM